MPCWIIGDHTPKYNACVGKFMLSDVSPIYQKEMRFRDFQFWPLTSVLDIRSWLGNFDEKHHSFALNLLDAFVYLSDPVVDAMLQGTIQRLVDSEFSRRGTGAKPFLECALFVIVQGERPSVSDSGHIFARKLRDKIGVNERNIVDPRQALSIAHRYSDIVFIDDFIGSGMQMLYTWARKHTLDDGSEASFIDLDAKVTHSFHYCSTICSYVGHQNLSGVLPSVKLHAAHLLRPSDCLSDPSHPIWKGYGGENVQLLQEYSGKAGYLAEDGSEDDWRGFHRQGLGLAFSHGVPDATLPLFRSTRNSWQPLIKLKVQT